MLDARDIFVKSSGKCTFGVGCARPTMACLSGVVATVLISKLWGSSCVTVVKKGGPGREDPGKWVDDPFTSLWPRKYKATCLRMVDVRGPLSCWTAVKRDNSDTEQEVKAWSRQVYNMENMTSSKISKEQRISNLLLLWSLDKHLSYTSPCSLKPKRHSAACL